eukprot:5045424-Pleurochrysis_carterae.AAC.1
MGHRQGFTAIYVMEGYVGYPPRPIGYIRSAAMFYVVPVATIIETMFYMGLRAISGCISGKP